MDINVKIYVNGKNYKTLCKTVINADTVQCEISFDNHSFDVEFDNTAITLKNIDGLKVDTVKTLRFKANFTSMKKFKWDLMEIVTDIVGLLADRHIGYKNMEELYDNAIKNHCIKPEATESETATEPETADQGETAEKKMDDVVFETLIRNAKAFPPCDFPGATKLLNICQQMNKTQLSDFCKILIEKGIFTYEYGEIVTTKGRLLICHVPDISGGD